MKTVLSAFTIAVLMAACNANPKATLPADTSGFAQFQSWKQQNELANKNTVYNQSSEPVTKTYPAPATLKTHTAHTENHSTNSKTHAASNESGTMTSESSNTAMRKKGWSKAAKGAAIGGGTGAVIGAVVNKHNRAAGAVIGGVVGGGVGYGVGRKLDKKEGRF